MLNSQATLRYKSVKYPSYALAHVDVMENLIFLYSSNTGDTDIVHNAYISLHLHMMVMMKLSILSL